MIDFFRSLFKPERSSTTAKERLRLVLLSDHLSLAPEVVEALKRDLLAVISRYVEIDASNGRRDLRTSRSRSRDAGERSDPSVAGRTGPSAAAAAHARTGTRAGSDYRAGRAASRRDGERVARRRSRTGSPAEARRRAAPPAPPQARASAAGFATASQLSARGARLVPLVQLGDGRCGVLLALLSACC